MTLIDWLILWSVPNEPVDYETVIELIVSKYEELATDADFLWWSIAKYPRDVLWLSSRIVRLNDLFPPPSMTWVEWFKAIEVADSL